MPDLSERIAALPPTEQLLVESIVARLERGLASYGPWKLNDGRDLKREALEEILDAQVYVAAELLRGKL